MSFLQGQCVMVEEKCQSQTAGFRELFTRPLVLVCHSWQGFIFTECSLREIGTKQNFPSIITRLYKNCKFKVAASCLLSTWSLKLHVKDSPCFPNLGKRFKCFFSPGENCWVFFAHVYLVFHYGVYVCTCLWRRLSRSDSVAEEAVQENEWKHYCM